jgi:hypothetical protein
MSISYNSSKLIVVSVEVGLVSPQFHRCDIPFHEREMM